MTVFMYFLFTLTDFFFNISDHTVKNTNANADKIL